ncbi:scavenger receptor class F member 1-like [Saccostrea cucullata]|uniref:scavenger receptor class F member 1-like n=1 Tax=Saccostrea cuccullata TaxID=36930 RepID=UPI002ED09D4C
MADLCAMLVVLLLGTFHCYDLVICSPNCVDMLFDREGKCIRGCNRGYWGDKCEKNCPSTCSVRGCNRANGFCNCCIDGHYGDKCEKSCYLSCSGRSCNKDTGDCTNGCVAGKYGSNCQFSCGKCSTGKCERNTGYCENCETGYFGRKCERKCSENCLNQECGKMDGHCNNGCYKGFYGFLCNMSCRENCVQTKCIQNNVCIYGCKTDMAGNECNNRSCIPNNGSCMDRVKQNTYVHDGKQSSVINVASKKFAVKVLFGIIAIIITLILLSVFLIVRKVRQRRNQILTRGANAEVTDKVENIAGYQELGQLSQPSHYEKLK